MPLPFAIAYSRPIKSFSPQAEPSRETTSCEARPLRRAPAAKSPASSTENGKIRDLSKIVKDIDGDARSPASLAKIKKANIDKLPLVKGNPRLGSCVAKPGNFIAIGLNYADHAAEAGMPIPQEPIIFNKAPTCDLRAERSDTIIPKDSSKLDWEVELGIIIGSRAPLSHQGKRAMSVVAGYCLSNDVSERVFQIERAGQWTKGKGCETLRPARPLAGHQGRDQGPAEPRHVARPSTARSPPAAATPRP